MDVIGLNCSTGPEHMRQPVRFLGENSRLPISVIPNAGHPAQRGRRTRSTRWSRSRSPTQMEEFVTRVRRRASWAAAAAPTPEHIRAAGRRASAALTPKRARGRVRPAPLLRRSAPPTWCRSPRPTMIGERVNAQGSRKVKRHLLEDDYDGVLEVAREQVEGGAHVLDVCVALTERQDEGEQMRTVVKLLSQAVEAPLCIDSTEARRHRGGAEAVAGARRSSTRSTWRTAASASTRCSRRRRARRRGDRADDRPRPRRDGEDRRDEARGGAEDPRHRHRGVRAAARTR